MFKPRLFYVIGEYVDDIEYCKRKGFKPHQKVIKQLDGMPLDVVTQYQKREYIYEVLTCEQCYSGYMLTLMRLPKLSYEELVKVALISRIQDERAGAIGILLKNYPNQFKQYLLKVCNNYPEDKRERKQIKRMANYICDFVYRYTSYVQDMEDIFLLCSRLKDYNTER